MIIKTDLKGLRALPYAFIEKIDETHVHFECYCGNQFSLRSTNKYVSDAQYACPDCKRIRRLMPLIGERYVYKRIRSDAAGAGRVFEIGFDWFVKKCHEPCFYCGSSDGNRSTVPSKVAGKVLLQDFKYNGLDRVHNDVGYVEWNCVPCCIICNRAKNSMPFIQFMEWIHQMVRYRLNQEEL